jgi:hypothetical protein
MENIFKVQTTKYKMDGGDGMGVNVIFLKSPKTIYTKFLRNSYGY